jgi:hypothetical protein
MAKSKKIQQQQQRNRPTLPLRKASASKKTAKQKPIKRGIHFPNDQIAQDHIQNILIEILTKWRQCKPKNKHGEPPKGSLTKLFQQYSRTQLWLQDCNKLKMKWRNMCVEDKVRINLGLPLEQKNNNNKSPQQKLKSTANSGRPIGTTNKSKQEQKQKLIDMKNDIALAWSQVKDLPPDQKPNLVDIIKQMQDEFGLDPSIYPVSTNCIYSRVDCKRLDVKQTGQVSPAMKIEPRLVLLIELSTQCYNEMTREDIIEFANLYIKGTEVEQEILSC